MSAPANGPAGGNVPPDPARGRASHAGLWGALFGAGAAAAAILALRPAPGGTLVLQPAGGGALPQQPTRDRGHGAPSGDRNRTGQRDSDSFDSTNHAEREEPSKRIISGYGFWIFLLSDIIMFAAFFASYVVLVGETAGGPSGHDLFDLRNTGIETGCLLISSFTCGLASVGLQAHNNRWFYGAMAATFVLGAAFVGLEVREFWSMVADGNGPGRSAFLSAFFALVGLHGLHVSAGLLWLLTMMAQVWAKGYRDDILRRVMCFSLFWHALDIVWVALFTVVYLMGVAP
ncbi:MAG: cytochrome (ubi)quinol oxidase subunit III [Janthinobacterium lividum]